MNEERTGAVLDEEVIVNRTDASIGVGGEKIEVVASETRSDGAEKGDRAENVRAGDAVESDLGKGETTQATRGDAEGGASVRSGP